MGSLLFRPGGHLTPLNVAIYWPRFGRVLPLGWDCYAPERPRRGAIGFPQFAHPGAIPSLVAAHCLRE